MELQPDEIAEILRVFAESDMEELRIEIGGTVVHASKLEGGLRTTPVAGDPGPASSRATLAPTAAATSETRDPTDQDGSTQALASGSTGTPPATAAPAAQPRETGDLLELHSPLLGVFFRRPAPDQPPFVEIGGSVGPDDPVCIVDVMKMFTRVPAGLSGTLVEVCVEDGQLVEHGQVLMRFAPA